MDEPSIRIVESYRGYTPPFDVSKVVRTLLSIVPEKYTRGLDCVVLTNTDSVPRRQTRRKVWSRNRKVRLSQVRGLYHHKWQGKPPWIELRVEKILSGFFFKNLLWVPLFRMICLGEVLYHELGHHIHRHVRPEYKEKEDVADEWGSRLLANFLLKKYWFAFGPLALVVRMRKKIRERRAARGSGG